MKKTIISFFVVLIMAMIILIMVKAISYVRLQGAYISDASDFQGHLVEYLDDYFDKNKRYPDDLDISKFDISKKTEYSEVLNKINYTSSGDKFILTWEKPQFLGKNPDNNFFHITIEGDRGNISVTTKELNEK